MGEHITAIVPAYNTAWYIAECLDSIRSINYDNYDVIVVDDCSNDRTPYILNDYLRRMCNLSVIRLKSHTNVTNATKVGIEYAQGDIITIIDSDDRVLSNAFQLAIKPFSVKDVGFVWSKFHTSAKSHGWSHPLPKGQNLWQAMMNGWWKAAHHKFFRKSWYRKTPGLNPKFDRSSDYQLVFLMGFSNCQTVHIPIDTYWYRLGRPGSLTSEGRSKQVRATEEIKKWISKLPRRVKN